MAIDAANGIVVAANNGTLCVTLTEEQKRIYNKTYARPESLEIAAHQSKLTPEEQAYDALYVRNRQPYNLKELAADAMSLPEGATIEEVLKTNKSFADLSHSEIQVELPRESDGVSVAFPLSRSDFH